MASQSAMAAVDAYLSVNFSTCPVYELGKELEPPPDLSAFVQVQYPLGLEEQMSIGSPGSNRFREEGVIRFVIHTPQSQGVAASATLADELRTLMRNKRFDGVRTFEAPPITLDDGSDHAGYLQSSFAVAYEFDITA